MKTLYHKIVLFLVIFLFSFSSDEEDTCLKIKGTVLGKDGKKIKHFTVTLYEDGKELGSMKCFSAVKLFFPRNHYFSMMINYPGHTPALLIFDTSLPENYPELEADFEYQFEFQLKDEKKEYNKEYIDYPVAVVRYEQSNDNFSHSEKYDKFIKKMINAKSLNVDQGKIAIKN